MSHRGCHGGGEEAVTEEAGEDQILITTIITDHDQSGSEHFILVNKLPVIHYITLLIIFRAGTWRGKEVQ